MDDGRLVQVYILPEGSKPTRGRFELGFGQIGMGVLGGFGFGASKGLFKGLADPAMKPLVRLPLLRSRLPGDGGEGSWQAWTAWRTQMLNYLVKHASAAARPMGTLMLFYAGSGTLLSLARGGADDELNTIASAALTGALFRAPAGVAKAPLPSLRAG